MSKQFNFKQLSFAEVHSFNVKRVLLQPNQFSISTQFQCQKQFYFEQFSLAYKNSLVLFEPMIVPDQVLPLWVRVELGVMAMKE